MTFLQGALLPGIDGRREIGVEGDPSAEKNSGETAPNNIPQGSIIVCIIA